MDDKQYLLKLVLSYGFGFGIGCGAAVFCKWAVADDMAEKIERELMRLVLDGKESKVSFDEFPYYLCEQTRALLTSAAFVNLKQVDISKYIRNLSPASRAILLSGPAELYLQKLAKALAQCFEAKLLLLDVPEFSWKIQSKYGDASKIQYLKRLTSEATFEKVSSLLGSSSLFPQLKEAKAKLRRFTSWSFEEELIKSLYKVLDSVSKANPIILHVRDVKNLLYRSERTFKLFQKMLKRISGPVLVLGSRIMESGSYCEVLDDKLLHLFRYNIKIKPPEDETQLISWKSQLEEDTKTLQFQDNRNHVSKVLAANDLDCDDLGQICLADSMILTNYIEEVIVTAVCYHLMNNKDPEYKNGKLVISSKSLSYGLSIFEKGKQNGKDTSTLEANTEETKDALVDAKSEEKVESSTAEGKPDLEKLASGIKKDVESSSAAPKITEFPPDNEFEKRIRPEIIPANKIGVTLDDIGALDDIKESLQELVMLPLQRPDLYKGGLLKPCRGILLFGPPGTGKTMLAKAIANEAGASFINVSMSTITSKWFGEDEKNVRALFSLAAKVAPTIIFVDEVDSMLGQRTRVGEHEAMRKIKNEFMSHWDGLLTKQVERILVLAATNRPFDLDEAIIRRFERRIMVGLPAVENREQILKTLLSKENVEGLDFKELAVITEGYSGSDLKTLCTAAAYRPVRDLIQREKEKQLLQELKEKGKEDDTSADAAERKEENGGITIKLRPLNMNDMRLAKNQVAASFAADGAVMSELIQWNELYGEGGSRKKMQLSYFL